MITINLNDPHCVENIKAMQELKEVGYTDEQLQRLYDRQIVKDRCDKCQYRKAMAKAFDVHIWYEECPEWEKCRKKVDNG